MSAGDNTRDDRWRPGFASSERRVREELADAAAESERRVFSRELSFVPSQTTPKFEAHVEKHFAIDPFFHPSSYAGSELGARVVEAVVERYEDPSLLEHVREMGPRLAAGLDKIVARHPDRLAARRGLGLMQALETRSEAMGFNLTRACFQHGLLAIFAFNRQSTRQIMPPLIITADEIDDVLERLDLAVQAMPD